MNKVNIQDVFHSYIHEDVLYCENTDYLGGIADILYCYQPNIEYLPIPSRTGTNESAGRITSIVCKQYTGFKSIKALIETAFLTNNFADGNVQDTTELTAFLLGTRSELIGFSRKIREKPYTFIVRDNNGKLFLLGTLQSPAYLKEFTIQTGTKFDDNCGAEIKFRSNSILFEFTGEVPVGTSDFGDFSNDFSNDFD